MLEDLIPNLHLENMKKYSSLLLYLLLSLQQFILHETLILGFEQLDVTELLSSLHLLTLPFSLKREQGTSYL